jgi:hypothetical protein
MTARCLGCVRVIRWNRVAGFVSRCWSCLFGFRLGSCLVIHTLVAMRCGVSAPGEAAPAATPLGFTRTFSGGAPRGPPPVGFTGAAPTVTPLRRPDLPPGGDTGAEHHAGHPAALDTRTLSHGSGWSTSTPSQLPNPEKFIRENCIWDLDKNTLSRMKMRWLNTLQRERHPDVSLAYQEKITFNPSSPERYSRPSSYWTNLFGII